MSKTSIPFHRQVRGEKTSVAVVKAVAEASGKESLELSPLYNIVDPDGLNRLFPHRAKNDSAEAGRVAFPWEECWIVVRDDEITVRPEDDSHPSMSHSRKELFRVQHNWEANGDVCSTLLQALETISPRGDASRRSPLSNTVDPDALNRIFDPVGEERGREAGWLCFTFDEYFITVEASGKITLAPNYVTNERGAA
jgi:hypothetical protein